MDFIVAYIQKNLDLQKEKLKGHMSDLESIWRAVADSYYWK